MFIAQPAEEDRVRAPRPCWRRACSRDFQSPISALPCTQLAPSPMAPCSIAVGVGSSSCRRPLHQIPRPRRSRRGAAGDHRSRDDGRALCRRCSERDQPRKGSDRIRRCQHRRDPWRHRGKHHSRRSGAARAPSAPSSRRCAPRCSQGSSGQRRRSPPCRMRRSPMIKITEGTKAVMNDPGVVAHGRKSAESGVRRQAQANRRRSRPAKIIRSSSAPACPRCSSISASTSRSASLPPARAKVRRCRPTTRPCSRRCRSRPSRPAITAMTLAVLSAFDQKARRK